jgi:hypothetical protein
METQSACCEGLTAIVVLLGDVDAPAVCTDPATTNASQVITTRDVIPSEFVTNTKTEAMHAIISNASSGNETGSALAPNTIAAITDGGNAIGD